MRTQRLLFLLTVVLATLPWAGSARAHDFWIERQGGVFVLRYGHHGGEVLALNAAKIKTLTCRQGAQASRNVLASARIAPKQLTFTGPCALVSAFHDGGFWSLTPDGEKNLPRNQVPDSVKSWRSQQFAKWVDVHSPMAGQPLGDGFEIVPVSDLSKVKTGNKATFRVLLAGKPLSGATLAIDHKPLGETDDQGEVRVKVRATSVESVSASFRRAVKTPEADSEVFEASLTFEVAH
jgi:ABC-type Co2+ transport system, periplasmic component